MLDGLPVNGNRELGHWTGYRLDWFGNAKFGDRMSDTLIQRVLLAKRFAGIEAQEAAMTSVDRLGFHLRLKTQDGVKGTRIAFLREVSNPSQTREVFVEMVKQAREG